MQNVIYESEECSEFEDDMRDEYDFSGGVRGKFYEDPIPQIRTESRPYNQKRG